MTTHPAASSFAPGPSQGQGEGRGDLLAAHLPALLAAKPATRTSRRADTRKIKEKKKRQRDLQQALWMAMDQGDAQALERALKEGASPHLTRDTAPPLWQALSQERYDLAQILVNHGAKLDAMGQWSQGMWAAIAPRNSVAEGERVKEMAGGVDFGTGDDFFRHQAWDLGLWWIKENKGKRIPSPSPTGSFNKGYYTSWLLAALHGPEEIIALLNQAWGVDASTPRGLELRFGSGIAEEAWEEIAKCDNVVMAQRALAYGWGPPAPPEGSNPKRFWWSFSPAWFFLTKRAVALWEWWMGVPALAQAFVEEGARAPEHTLWHVPTSVPMMERLRKAGVNMQARDSEGQSLLHLQARAPSLSTALVRWWLDHFPEALSWTDGQRLAPLETPLNDLKSSIRPKVQAARTRARAALMDAQMAPANPALARARDRL